MGKIVESNFEVWRLFLFELMVLQFNNILCEYNCSTVGYLSFSFSNIWLCSQPTVSRQLTCLTSTVSESHHPDHDAMSHDRRNDEPNSIPFLFFIHKQSNTHRKKKKVKKKNRNQLFFFFSFFLSPEQNPDIHPSIDRSIVGWFVCLCGIAVNESVIYMQIIYYLNKLFH